MAQYYYTKNGERHGPVEVAELQDLVSSGQVGPAEYYWTSGMADWQKVGGDALFAGGAASTAVADMTSDTGATDLTPADSGAETAPAPAWTQPSDVAAATFGTPASAASAYGATSSDAGSIKRIAEAMPKPVWLLVVAVATGLGGLIASIGIITIIFTWAIIWSAVLLFQANSALESARSSGSEHDLTNAAKKLNTYFTIQAVWIIIGFVFMIGLFALGGVANLGTGF